MKRLRFRSARKAFHISILALLCALFASFAHATEWPTALPAPVAADYQAILNHRTSTPTVFSYQGGSAITLIDFPSLAEQGRMFNRIVALIERIGAPRGEVLDNAGLARFIEATGKTDTTLAYGNDFMVAELVVFFNLADLGKITLNPEEIALRQHLLDRNLMVLRHGFYQSVTPAAVILSLPQEVPASPGSPAVTALARRTILAHELSHAEYYSNPAYRQYSRQFWAREMTEAQRAAFRRFLADGGYNPENEEMMMNEAQAYLVHTPDPRAFSARMLGLSSAELTRLQQRFRNGYPQITYP